MSKFVIFRKLQMETTTVNSVDIPDGTYNGLWSGYDIVLEGYKNIKIKTSDGIKGINIPCTIEIKNKEGRIKSMI